MICSITCVKTVYWEPTVCNLVSVHWCWNYGICCHASSPMTPPKIGISLIWWRFKSNNNQMKNVDVDITVTFVLRDIMSVGYWKHVQYLNTHASLVWEWHTNVILSVEMLLHAFFLTTYLLWCELELNYQKYRVFFNYPFSRSITSTQSEGCWWQKPAEHLHRTCL